MDWVWHCGKCGKWYHIDCVHLTGLSPDNIKMLTNWLCFQCVCSKFVLDHDPPIHSSIRQIIREELTSVTEELVSVTKSAQSGVKNEVKTYADVMKSNQKEVLGDARGPALVKDVCKSMSMEQIERKKKLKNVVISNVPEAPSNLVGDQRLVHDIQFLSSDEVKMNPN